MYQKIKFNTSKNDKFHKVEVRNAKIVFRTEQICLSLALRAVVEINLMPPIGASYLNVLKTPAVCNFKII